MFTRLYMLYVHLFACICVYFCMSPDVNDFMGVYLCGVFMSVKSSNSMCKCVMYVCECSIYVCMYSYLCSCVSV